MSATIVVSDEDLEVFEISNEPSGKDVENFFGYNGAWLKHIYNFCQ